jgi:hypothetical protein
MGPIRCPETSVNNYHTTPCNYPEDHRCHQHRGGSLKSKLTTRSVVTPVEFDTAEPRHKVLKQPLGVGFFYTKNCG